MNTKTDEGLYEKARKLFISKASIDEFAGWATPRQVDAVHRLLDTELANRERAKHDRLLRRARFPVVKGLDGYDFTNVRLPDGYMLDELLGLGFIPRAQDLVFYGKTGRGKTHLAIGLGMKAIDMGLGVRFHQTAELVLQLGKAKRDGTLETMLRDIRHRPCRPDHTGRVRLRTLRHRRGAPALPDHRGQLRKTEHHIHHEHRVQ